MKICIATHHYPPKYIGGAEQYAYRLAHHLSHNGHDIAVATVDSITEGELIPISRTEMDEDIQVHHIAFDIFKAKRSFPLFHRNPYLGDWFKTFFNEFKPDLLHVNSGYLLSGTVIEAARAVGIPIVLTLHEFWFLCPLNTLLRTNGQVCAEPVPPARCKWCMLGKKRRYRSLDQFSNGRIGDAYVRLASSPLLGRLVEKDVDIEEIKDRRDFLLEVFGMVDLVISPSHFLIEKMKAYGFDHANFVRLPYGLQNIPTIITDKKKVSDCLRVGYLGRISPEKGVDVLIRAFRLIERSDISLDIFGQMDEKEPYHRYLRRLANGDPRIQFRGRYHPSELPEVLGRLDVTVVPSKWYENRPGTILEAFAYRTPVVASRLGGMIEMIQHDVNGLLFSVNDEEDLSRQLIRLLNEPDLLPRLQEEILPVERVEDEIRQTLDHYQKILEVYQRSSR